MFKNFLVGIATVAALWLSAPSLIAGRPMPSPEEYAQQCSEDAGAIYISTSVEMEQIVADAFGKLDALADKHVSVVRLVRVVGEQIGQLERASNGGSQRMHRVIDRGVARLRKMGASADLIGTLQNQGLDAEYLSGLHYFESAHMIVARLAELLSLR